MNVNQRSARKSPTHATAILRPDPEEIARCAYREWENDGRPVGRDLHYWFEAESRLCHPDEHHSFPTRTILVVDDDPLVCKTIATILRAEGYHVLDTTCPHEALRVAKNNGRIDLLLTDYEMPGLSGIQLAGRLRAENPGLPVLLVSGTPDAVEAGGEIPADIAFRTKPGIVAEVAAVVDALLRRKYA